jgi:hypothetical protein
MKYQGKYDLAAKEFEAFYKQIEKLMIILLKKQNTK